MGIFRCSHWVAEPRSLEIESRDGRYELHGAGMGVQIIVEGICDKCGCYVKTSERVGHPHLYQFFQKMEAKKAKRCPEKEQ